MSKIAGRMSAKGTVVLTNPNGIMFHNGSTVDVGALVTSTKHITPEDFMAGRDRFTTPEGHKEGKIHIAKGATIKSRGLGAFVGKHVSNEGAIVAKTKGIAIGTGKVVSFDLYGDDLISLEVAADTQDTLIENKGLIQVDQGHVVLNADSAEVIIDNLVNDKHIKKGVHLAGGEIKASKSIKVLAKNIDIKNTKIDASSDGHGGTILIGGDYQGSGDTPRAQNVKVD